MVDDGGGDGDEEGDGDEDDDPKSAARSVLFRLGSGVSSTPDPLREVLGAQVNACLSAHACLMQFASMPHIVQWYAIGCPHAHAITTPVR